MPPLAGLDAAPYHAVSLAAHAACVALLAACLGRVVSRPAALVGAIFFAVHPALFTALHWISAAGDSLTLLGALGALLLALRGPTSDTRPPGRGPRPHRHRARPPRRLRGA